MRTFIFIIVCSVFFFIGCKSTKEIKRYEDLKEASIYSGNLQLISNDSSVYFLDRFTYTDSSIFGWGEKEHNSQRSAFKGELYFKDISFIQSRESNTFGTALYMGAAIYLVYQGVALSVKDPGVSAVVDIISPYYGGGESSCPFIYSWNGTEYKIEGEAFGTALGRQMEIESCTTLPDLSNDKGKLKIKITNERPETDFFNRIKLVYVSTGKDVEVYSDNHNRLWEANVHSKINQAVDLNGKDITSYILNKDECCWTSDLGSANSGQSFEDKIFLELPASKSDSLSLLITAINTEISSVVFRQLQLILGDEYVNFMKAAETDPDVINVLKETLTRCALKVDVWDGKTWKYVDLLYPEANYVSFNKLIRVPVINSDIIKLRLRCLTDLWRIDAIHFDDSHNTPLQSKEVALLSAKHNDQYIVKEISEADSSYTKLIPGEFLNLEFEAPPLQKDKKNSYALLVQGYLYEWIIDSTNPSALAYVNPASRKVQFVKNLISDMDMFLLVVYSEWKNVRNKKE